MPSSVARLGPCSLLAFAAAIVATPLGGQARLGAKLGASVSSVALDPLEGDDPVSLTAFTGGFTAALPMGLTGLHFQPEIVYARKGSRFEEFNPPSEIRIGYIEVPLLLRYDIAHGEFTPFVYAGIAPAFRVSCEIGATDASFEIAIDCQDELLDLDIRGMDLGVPLGGGLALPLGPGELVAEGRYTLGMTDIDTDSRYEVKNRSLSVTLGFVAYLRRGSP